MFRKMRYIPDMGLATMRTGCGRNKTYAPSGSQQQPLTGPKKTPYMPGGHIRSFLWSKSVCVGSCRPACVQPVHQERDGGVPMPAPAPEALRSCADMPGRTLQETVAKAGGNTLRSGQRGRSGRMPGKEKLPLYPILGKGIRPLFPALPGGNTATMPCSSGRESGHHALLFREGTRSFIRPFRTFRTERRLYFFHSRDL